MALARSLMIAVVLLGRDGGAADASWRKRFPPTLDEVFRYAETLIAIDEFRETIYYCDECVTIGRGTVESGLREVHRHLDHLGVASIGYAYNYVRNKLIDYCDVAIDLLEEGSNGAGFVDSLSEALRIQYDFADFCVVTFLFHSASECPVDHMFALIMFFQTLPRRFDRFALAEQIRKLKYALNVYFDYNDSFQLEMNECLSFAPYEGLSDALSFRYLSRFKYELKSLSKTLCSPTAVPIVDEDVFSAKDAVDDYYPQDDFIDYTMREEKCYVDFQTTGNTFYEHQKSIKKWDCDNVLTSPEYGIEDYIQATRSTRQRKRSRSPPRAKHDLLKDETTAGPRDGRLFALPELKKRLLLYRVGADVLSYNKIKADAIAVAAAKEGYKMLKAVAYTSKQMCKNEVTRATFDEIRARMTSKLFALKSINEKLRDRISEKLLTDVGGHSLDEFDRLMEMLLGRLSLRDGRGERFAESACNRFETGFFNDINTDDYVDDEHKTLAFREFHFVGPILNTHRLYESVAIYPAQQSKFVH